MATWQFTIMVFVVLLPFSLLMDFWPRSERCDARGRPLPRAWAPPVRKAVAHDEH